MRPVVSWHGRGRIERDAGVYTYVVEVEDVDQVGHVVTAPLGQLLAVNALEAVGGGPLLDEHDLRAVVRVLGEHLATTGPRRDDVRGNAEALRGCGQYVLLD